MASLVLVGDTRLGASASAHSEVLWPQGSSRLQVNRDSVFVDLRHEVLATREKTGSLLVPDCHVCLELQSSMPAVSTA
jgi:hypothetical protein